MAVWVLSEESEELLPVDTIEGAPRGNKSSFQPQFHCWYVCTTGNNYCGVDGVCILCAGVVSVAAGVYCLHYELLIVKEYGAYPIPMLVGEAETGNIE